MILNLRHFKRECSNICFFPIFFKASIPCLYKQELHMRVFNVFLWIRTIHRIRIVSGEKYLKVPAPLKLKSIIVILRLYLPQLPSSLINNCILLLEKYIKGSNHVAWREITPLHMFELPSSSCIQSRQRERERLFTIDVFEHTLLAVWWLARVSCDSRGEPLKNKYVMATYKGPRVKSNCPIIYLLLVHAAFSTNWTVYVLWLICAFIYLS